MSASSDSARLVWEQLDSARASGGLLKLEWTVHRAKVPGGWLVLVMHNTSGITFYPDAEHRWDGGSLPPSQDG